MWEDSEEERRDSREGSGRLFLPQPAESIGEPGEQLVSGKPSAGKQRPVSGMFNGRNGYPANIRRQTAPGVRHV